jgi:murein peptide amidase A
MLKLKLFLNLLMIFSLMACAITRNEPSVYNSAGAGAPQEPKTSAESEVPTDFELPSKLPGKLSGENKKADDFEVPNGPRIGTSVEKNLVAAEVVRDSEQKESFPTLDSFVDDTEIKPGVITEANSTAELCQEVGNKLGSISVEDCLSQNLTHSAYTIARRSLAFKDYLPKHDRESLGRVLVIGGIHGDEYSSVSVIFKWMKILNENHSGLFHWRFVPTANPDGLLSVKSQRQNSNGVDLNRNFPTKDWLEKAKLHWEQKTYRNPRRHPGPDQASELETQWIVKQIKEFKPDVIVSLHAPYHLIDYDGPPTAPKELGGLSLRRLGVYPGSLGNYAGIDLQVPIVTVELKSAGIMPDKKEVDRMWRDLVGWLKRQLPDPT